MIDDLEERINKLETEVMDLNVGLKVNMSQISENVHMNKVDIKTNIEDIADMKENITQNTEDIAKNVALIAQTNLTLAENSCAKPHFIGDGYCDDELNKEECNYDGGDCCGMSLDNNFCRE